MGAEPPPYWGFLGYHKTVSMKCKFGLGTLVACVRYQTDFKPELARKK